MARFLLPRERPPLAERPLPRCLLRGLLHSVAGRGPRFQAVEIVGGPWKRLAPTTFNSDFTENLLQISGAPAKACRSSQSSRLYRTAPRSQVRGALCRVFHSSSLPKAPPLCSNAAAPPRIVAAACASARGSWSTWSLNFRSVCNKSVRAGSTRDMKSIGDFSSTGRLA